MSSNKFASFSIIIFMILANVSNTVSAQYWQELNMGLEQGPRVLFSDSTSNLLWAGGNFVMADSVVVNGITKWDGADWHSVGIGLPDISPIADIASFIKTPFDSSRKFFCDIVFYVYYSYDRRLFI